VHEWGTFTSVAGDDGQSVAWRPLSEPSDLPCFVQRLPDGPKQIIAGGWPALAATVRMETPVLYFYSDVPASASVRVQFPQGLISEWYPSATLGPAFYPFDLRKSLGSAEWTNVRIVPDSTAALPREPGDSHYYAARETDASPVHVGAEFEKFLFYRGVADFPVPLSVRLDGGRRVVVSHTGTQPIRRMILFENQGGRIGFRVVSADSAVTTSIDLPSGTASFAGLRAELERQLVEEGLFAREAHAMVETWRDSWFEPGARLFYILPRALTDAILPLAIDPTPAKVARVFVGRIEIVTPAMEADVARAIAANDMRALHEYGRVLEPIASRLVAAHTAGLDAARVQRALQLVAASRQAEATCR
jgi:hypothetical protein